MKKVCMVVWNKFQTDARVTREARSLVKAGYDVTVIAVNEPGRTKQYEEKEGFRVKRINCLPFGLDSLKQKIDYNEGEITASTTAPAGLKQKQGPGALLKQALRLLARVMWRYSKNFIMSYRFYGQTVAEKADVYHAHDLNTLFPVFLAAARNKCKLVYDAHEISTDRAGWGNKWFWQLLEKSLIKRADAVITTNETRGQYLVDHYKTKMPYIIKNYPEYRSTGSRKKMFETLKLPTHCKIILYQGGMQPERGLEKVVEAVPSLLDLPICFVFLGNGSLKPRLVRLTEELGIQKSVFFLEAVPLEELQDYTECAFVGLQVLQNTCFNHYSACSNKIHEYLMAGVPVISSDLPEMRKVIEESEAGLLINPHKPEEIARAIRRFVENEGEYKQFKENALKRGNKYNWGNEEKKLHEIYNQLG